uniref:RNase H type-1 domain-containing protein n=1 Tax=Leersia perrieri TaxID=77586 RepID=A0A0D9XVE6_9ORYZ
MVSTPKGSSHQLGQGLASSAPCRLTSTGTGPAYSSKPGSATRKGKGGARSQQDDKKRAGAVYSKPSTCSKMGKTSSMKLNVDGSFHPCNGTAGTGMVMRDRNGQLEVEIIACRDGLKLALQWTMLPARHPIVAEDDCSTLPFFIHELQQLAVGERSVKIVKIHHDQNKISHVLANSERLGDHLGLWLGHHISPVDQLIHEDYINSYPD